MKKLLIAFVLFAFCILFSAAAQEERTVHVSGDYEYVLLENGTAEITSYKGKAENLTIPGSLAGYSVTAIGDGAFAYSFSLTGVTIPESVSKIGSNPFIGCTKLATIRVSPKSPYFATIDGVLYSKTEKKLVTYPAQFESESYLIPDGILAIGADAFRSIDYIMYVTVPDGLTEIGAGAFYGCYSLTDINIPDSVKTIGNSAFRSCESLSGITIPEGVTEIADGAFHWCISFGEVTIPNSVTVIGNSAFQSCWFLESVRIPGSVTKIGEDAFDECESAVFIVDPDSYAERWAIENGYNYAYVESLDWLIG